MKNRGSDSVHGSVRMMNKSGRVYLPFDMREDLFLAPNDAVEYFIEDNKIIIRKYEPGCAFCGQAKDVKYFKSKCICHKCIYQISEL